jgi:putrescine transport system permease protein
MSSAGHRLKAVPENQLRFDSVMQTLVHAKKLVVGVPYAAFLVFLFIPFLLVFFISFTESDLGAPPYTPIFSLEDGRLTIAVNFANYVTALTDNLYLSAFFSSIKIALINTLLCLLVGYPMAYCMARTKPAMRSYLLLMVMVPMWLSFLLRVYAWIAMVKTDGFINQFLLWTGLISEPLTLYRTNFSVYLVMVVSYLPLMIIPLYNCFTKLDESLLEAAADLGSRPMNTLFKITLPLSVSGIVAGCMLVFIPSVGEYIVPQLMGGADTLMLGKVIWQEFFSNLDWPMTSAITCLMVILLLVPLAIFNKHSLVEEQ